jgi:TATA-binding protein-associated factor Taf7
MYSVWSPYGASICLRHFMPDDEFTDVARQLEEKLSEMNQATDPALRRSMLSDMRRLIAEADRLNTESTLAKKAEKPDTGKW